MTREEILKHVDHTQLKAFCTWEDIRQLCREAVQHGAASVCIPPCYVKRVREEFQDAVPVCTVIGFPLGYNTTDVKVAEAEQAITDGAVEIDMVINIADVKNGDYGKVEAEIRALRKAAEGYLLKVIVETCYLSETEKIKLCRIITAAGADYIKTSTGFGTGGAAIEDIRLFQEHIGTEVKIKASGGIRTAEAMECFLKQGCERIGTSSAAEESIWKDR